MYPETGPMPEAPVCAVTNWKRSSHTTTARLALLEAIDQIRCRKSWCSVVHVRETTRQTKRGVVVRRRRSAVQDRVVSVNKESLMEINEALVKTTTFQVSSRIYTLTRNLIGTIACKISKETMVSMAMHGDAEGTGGGVCVQEDRGRASDLIAALQKKGMHRDGVTYGNVSYGNDRSPHKKSISRSNYFPSVLNPSSRSASTHTQAQSKARHVTSRPWPRPGSAL